MDRLLDAMQREQAAEAELAHVREQIRTALIEARSFGATYRTLARRLVPPTGELAETRRQRERAEANLRGRLYELRRRRVGAPDAESPAAGQATPCDPRSTAASCLAEVISMSNQPDDRDGYLKKRRIIEEEFVVPPRVGHDDEEDELVDDEAEAEKPRKR